MIRFIIPSLFTSILFAQSVWKPDLDQNTYRNPIIHADFSDPDVCRVGNDFYMTASSFNCVPGLPVLHSTDLIHWKIVNYALPKLKYAEGFDKPQHGKGVWAPCIRYYKGNFYIFFSDPDYGIFMTSAVNPMDSWSEPVLIKAGKGLIDPSPLWDDDGKAYLVYAFAGSRAGIKSLLVVCSMDESGNRAYDDDQIVFDGHDNHPTVEGPKFYKRNGYYYIFAPAGGVSTGWQLVLRSKHVKGPYESRIVMHQGNTAVNGPHQGAWVELENGEHWFIHFQDKGAYGRVVHLQPMVWQNDWPVIGELKPGEKIGQPVLKYRKPGLNYSGNYYPVESDEFNSSTLGLQWQWHANPEITWALPFPEKGALRLFARPLPPNFTNFWDVANLLLQKFPAPSFKATALVNFKAHDDEEFGLIIMGKDYSYLSVTRTLGKLFLRQTICIDADKGNAENKLEEITLNSSTFYLRVNVYPDGRCEFSFSEDGKSFKSAGQPFFARQGHWIGAKVGLFCIRKGFTNDAGYADVDWFRFDTFGNQTGKL